MRGYAWNGPDVIPDTLDTMRPSLVHDAGYQLLEEGLLPPEAKDALDVLLRDLCIEDGMLHVMAEFVYAAVRAFGKHAAFSPDNPIVEAPTPLQPYGSAICKVV